MKKILPILTFILLCCVGLWSCATSKKTTTTDKSTLSAVLDSGGVKNQEQTIVIDTTSFKNKKIKIIEMEFFQPGNLPAWVWLIDQDTIFDVSDNAGEGQADNVSNGLPESDRPPNNIKSLKITEIEDLDLKRGVTNTNTSSNDSINVKSKEDRHNDIKEKEDPTDPYKWRWITIAILCIFAIAVSIFLVVRWIFRK